MDRKFRVKHPSLPVPGSSKKHGASRIDDSQNVEPPAKPWIKRCGRYMYNKENNQFCGRTCKSWLYIIVYAIMYIIFLSTYTLFFLYGSLYIIKYVDDYQFIEKVELLTYSTDGIGLSATPTSLNAKPLIWYRNDPEDYQKYVNGLENLLSKRRKREAVISPDLGPCGKTPFGYGDNPCVILRINKQLKWSAKPINANSSRKDIPSKVQKWLKLEQKLWLHCDGYHSYDKEHIGKITYYPDPPGFDPDTFPLDKNSHSPLIGIQISEFTLGVSLAVQCKLWYEGGASTIEFLLYVTPRRI
ncbi:sodium/potassium-transporting ATPase subunit beta-1-like [Bicyclus anynana]|uniref:Sodium/potassium-transporting ATPase subunit beta-1-like n=1 Tax=Bicyclus anynana TaxID=110368 RepID=A0A6J1N7N4_BICAN|nr:sodium/potassium-transporting ATPase subunit beta-1-like [Bicyclus anynana]